MVVRMVWSWWRQKTKGTPAIGSVNARRYERIKERGMQALLNWSSYDQISQLESSLSVQLLQMSVFSFDTFLHRGETNDARLARLRDRDIEALQQIPDLAQVFILHHDGYVREAALKQLDGSVGAPGCIYALFWRTNDWVPEVREAAHEALARVLPQTSAKVIVPALKAALPRIASWGRWSQAGPEMITALAQRDDVASALVDDVIQSESAALTVVFRELCKTPKIDPQLERIFRTAHQPHIRAMALQTLLSGKARWPLPQRRKVWVDKPSGRSRMELQFQRRDITVDADVLGLLQRAVTDRASIVRKHALDGMIALRHDREMAHTLDALVAGLEDDPNSGVRSRVAFFQRKRREENP